MFVVQVDVKEDYAYVSLLRCSLKLMIISECATWQSWSSSRAASQRSPSGYCSRRLKRLRRSLTSKNSTVDESQQKQLIAYFQAERCRVNGNLKRAVHFALALTSSDMEIDSEPSSNTANEKQAYIRHLQGLYALFKKDYLAAYESFSFAVYDSHFYYIIQ